MTPARNDAALQLGPADAELLVGAVQELAYVRDLAGVMAIVRRVARDLSGADGVTFVLREGDLVHYAEENAIGPLWKGRRFPASCCISGWAMLHRQTVAIEDIYADPRIPHDAYRPTFVRSLAMVPVRRDDPVAAIGAYWGNRHAATARELSLLEALANTVAIALANAELWERTERALRARDEFLSVASHELRTPLTPIFLQLGSLERSIADGRDAGAARESLSRLNDQMRRLARLVDGLMELSSAAAGELTLAPERVELRAPIDRAVASLERARRASGSELDVQVERGVVGTWDPRRVEQIVENLLSNAIKYGGGKPIALAAVRHGDAARITVRDEGIGLDDDAKRRIFAQFERAVPLKHFGGFGMGLWLARQLAEAHGGRIDVESEAGHGALFTVTLPLDPPAPSRAPARPAALDRAGAAP